MNNVFSRIVKSSINMNTTLNKLDFKPIISSISAKQQQSQFGSHNLYNSNSVYSHQLPSTSTSTPTTSWYNRLTRKDKRLIFSGLNKSSTTTTLSTSSSYTSISSLLSSSSQSSTTSIQKRRFFNQSGGSGNSGYSQYSSSSGAGLVYVIMAVNVGVFLLWGLNEQSRSGITEMYQKFTLSPRNFEERPYTLLTAAFSHKDLGHLFVCQT
ncbi:hypothetical protein DFA_08112 [Cavenderia fasciculata]|uniref:Peptidase S54 rhomboid domain-containing protein n=1 Tax=Cavenderia fasciculata TaxID=261658 RepID=F4Q571_CACFS|nr:uncharacterized protein DFA_08112 [Cavenderia fasciculata]EGG17130.1 hypothetical protein DFA_08112 [Cavenderia fasciculata]|eukprot:XP_004355614.1 hypothetical protein DFA_08112 [Cavenderia fasciculata]